MAKLLVNFRLYVLALISVLLISGGCNKPILSKNVAPTPKNPLAKQKKTHVDHTRFFTKAMKQPQEVTRACLECHKDAAKHVMKTAHWKWLSGTVMRDGKKLEIGKKNQVNNFCISVQGNWPACTKCHAGYGWKSKDFDFKVQENVDCLVCHDNTGTYTKGPMGMPTEFVDLKKVAGGVGLPTRANCGACHFNGGGGMGVKHGDLDASLLNPNEIIDVHMGRLKFTCQECHKTEDHFISGKMNATYTADTKVKRVSCSQCHTEAPHKDRRLNMHTKRVACQTCHIPQFSKRFPTKMTWDWSKAGDGERKQDVHEYMKIKGEFTYDKRTVPEYRWFNGKMDRYVLGDVVANPELQNINTPLGSKADETAKIWPFKIHRAKQIWDPINKMIMAPLTAHKDGYWKKFDWELAVREGAKVAGLPYSGKYAFINTIMHWPTTHMVSPVEDALKCTDCHSKKGRMNWKELGYEGDPVGGK